MKPSDSKTHRNLERLGLYRLQNTLETWGGNWTPKCYTKCQTSAGVGRLGHIYMMILRTQKASTYSHKCLAVDSGLTRYVTRYHVYYIHEKKHVCQVLNWYFGGYLHNKNTYHFYHHQILTEHHDATHRAAFLFVFRFRSSSCDLHLHHFPAINQWIFSLLIRS